MVRADARPSVFGNRVRWLKRVTSQTAMRTSHATDGNQTCPAGENSAHKVGRKTRSAIVMKRCMGLPGATLFPVGAAPY
jgi:hypothetical protein